MKAAGYIVLGIIALVAVSVLIMVYGFGMTMFGLTLQRPIENKRTEVTRSTNQYVTTQQEALSSLARQYRKAQERGADQVQLDAIGAQMVTTANTIAPEQIPPAAQPIVQQYQ
jgi:hypothetical protein